jgi:glucosamine--fructose-6-phosphate aminotransferase (isomerizing)
MCGIVGYSGPQNAIEPVLEGLSRLEYRGYDSAGISFKANEAITTLKEKGKIENLKETVAKASPYSKIAIGHTRWATHGAVNQTNAHPHANDTFSVVHNGIIENASELKESLIKEGYEFSSETDSEVFLVLLTKNFSQTPNILKAISQSFSMIRGNSAFVVMNKENSTLYSVKRGAPLVCGENKTRKEVYVSSDPYALVGFTEIIYFPDDEVICESMVIDNEEKTSFYELDGSKSERFKVQKKQVNLDVVSKGDFEHFMLKEIYEQPALIGTLLDYYLKGEGKETLERVKEYNPKYLHVIGCGTAWHAGLVIKNYFEKFNKVRTSVELASEFRYRGPQIDSEDMGIFISQSGETADTLACNDLCLEAGIPSFSIVNVEGSTLYRNCNENFLIKGGVEVGVASTKAFSLQVLTGMLLSLSMSNSLNETEVKREFELLATRIDEMLHHEEEIKSIAQEIYNYKGFIFTGRGKYFPIALEGALKLKEIAYVHAEGYAAGELKHGPIALIDEEMVNIAIVGPELYEKTLSNAEEVKARRGVMILVGPKGDKNLEKVSDHYFGVDFEGLPNLSPVLVNVFMQLISYHIAKLKGTDIDKPRNLAKSVTVE